MDKNINLVEILKDCPRGTKFYSTMFGEVVFYKIKKKSNYPIICIRIDGSYCETTSDGRYYKNWDGECTLLPSKDQRDWRKFSAPWYKKERFDPNTLKPFDRVLMRDDKASTCWRCAFFSHKREKEITPYKYAATYGSYKFCIPYNKETEHLVGTTDEAPEYYRYWES